MVQLFLKSTQIKAEEWAVVYQQIEQVLDNFPLPLVRLESYNGYEKEQDKNHFELRVNVGEIDEYISFHSDHWSYTAGCNVYFYKNWEQQKEHLAGSVLDENKSIIWETPQPAFNDGVMPSANGQHFGDGPYIKTGSITKYILLAIGTVMEDVLADRAFVTYLDDSEAALEMDKVLSWLEGCFDRPFALPIFFDKPRLIKALLATYSEPKYAAHRLQKLHWTRYLTCMRWSLEHIGYDATFQCYAKILSNSWFGTFGFSDVLNPWIAATQDLESTLQLIAASKQINLAEDEHEKVEKYDLTHTLKSLLSDYILWTPQQREILEALPNNKAALETGSEDLFGIMRRMAGYRIDICPIVASQQELFEAFMYHDPKNGAVFKKIIEDWVTENADAYNTAKAKMEAALAEISPEKFAVDTAELPEELPEYQDFLQQFQPHEQFFVELAIQKNPYFLDVKTLVHGFCQDIQQLLKEGEDMDNYPKYILSTVDAQSAFHDKIMRKLKERRMVVTAHADFEQWVRQETDDSVLVHLYLLLGLKVYQSRQAYARYRILHEREHWSVWRKGAAFGVEV
ncbi:MAG: hypothetical protein AAF960_19730 [Bacteroidota bacterium]